MSDAVRCPVCGFVYWTSSYENWGTCTSCQTNNDQTKGARLVSSDKIFTYITDSPNEKLFRKEFDKDSLLSDKIEFIKGSFSSSGIHPHFDYYKRRRRK